MFAYCLNNPIAFSDPTGHAILIDDIAIWSMLALVVIVIPIVIVPPPIFQNTYNIFSPVIDVFIGTIDDFATIIQAKQKPASLPREGDPNSDEELLNEDGTVKQRRHYDENGNAEFDIDNNHSDGNGSHEFPHVHIWRDGSRISKPLDFGQFFYLLEY